MTYEALGPTKRGIALQLKRSNGMTLSALAGHLGISREAVRIQVNEMIHEGWLSRAKAPARQRKAGRPPTLYRLTTAGQHLFPKQYDTLAAGLLQVVDRAESPRRLHDLLGEFTEQRIALWRERLQGLSLEQRLRRLMDLYWEGDPFTELERVDGQWLLVEHNCPFLNVALHQPALCSSTVNLLTRLLGVCVVREERFQEGRNRCVFRILEDQPCELHTFELEPAVAPRGTAEPAPAR